MSNILLSELGTGPEFDDFNFSSHCDSSLKERLAQSVLIDWVIQAREDISWHDNIANAMYLTLRPEAFEVYQRLQGPVAISYAEWFYLKLEQFLRILLFDEVDVKRRGHDEIDPDEVAESIAPEDNDFETWFRLTTTICYCSGNRLQELREWLERRRKASGARPSAKSGWEKNQERDAVIRAEMSRGTGRREICRTLDRLGIPLTPGLQRRGFERWLDAWSDADARQSVQTLFSKVARR